MALSQSVEESLKEAEQSLRNALSYAARQERPMVCSVIAEAKQRAVGKYFMLSESDKLDMVQAICYIMCKAESEGTSHRGLQDALGVYPAGFWIDHLMDVHNALWSYYHDKKREKDLQDDLDALDDFIK